MAVFGSMLFVCAVALAVCGRCTRVIPGLIAQPQARVSLRYSSIATEMPRVHGRYVGASVAGSKAVERAKTDAQLVRRQVGDLTTADAQLTRFARSRSRTDNHSNGFGSDMRRVMEAVDGGWSAVSSVGVNRRSPLILGISAAGGLPGSAVVRAEDGQVPPAAGKVQLTKVIAESGLEDWTVSEYVAMRDDEPRTKAYEAAIQRRLQGMKGEAVVVDIGTGALALLAVMAAKAGAKKVYAIEINPTAANFARETVANLKLQDVIEVITGNSMEVNLPERVDLIVSELIGSIATQEGVEPIIKDAERRFLRDGGDTASRMIPARVETRIAPVKYTEHRIMKFASKRGILSRGKAEEGTLRPLRLRSKTRDLVFLSEPQVLESFDFGKPSDTGSVEKKTLKFEIPAKVKDDAKDFSGFAMWTRLVVDDQNIVEVKGQKVTSHWAYVVALMDDLPIPIAAPGSIELRASVDYASKPVRYTLDAECAI